MRRKGLLSGSSIFAAAILLAAPIFAAEPVPGEACTNLNYIVETGGPETLGVRHILRCDGSVWQHRMTIDADGNVGIGEPDPQAMLTNAGSTAVTGDLTPGSLSADQNNYNPTGLSGASVLRLQSSGAVNITGLAGGVDGRILTIFNIGTNNIVLKNQNAGSAASNRFAINADLTLGADQSATVIYDSTSQRWRSASIPFSAASSPPAGCFQTWKVWPDPTTVNSAWVNGVAGSADGTKLAMTMSGQIYTSSDSGITWTARDIQRSFTPIAMSADGTKLAAGNWGGNVYTSADSGVTWTAQTNSGDRNWTRIAISSDGTRILGAVHGGTLDVSTDSGSTWTSKVAGSQFWTGVSMSADGTKMAAAVDGGQIHVSTDSGANWTAKVAGNKYYVGIAQSADGTKIIAPLHDDGSNAYWYSTDSGANWTAKDGTTMNIQCTGSWWAGTAMSGDGTAWAISCNDGTMLSRDSGATWSLLLTDSNALTLSSDGKKIAGSKQAGVTVTSCDQWDVTTPCGVSSTGLAGYWKLNESSGSTTAADASGNSNTGTLTLMTPASDWVSGKIGGALDFDNSDDYVTVPNSVSLNITGELTIAGWIKKNSIVDADTLVSKADSTHLQWGMLVDDGHLAFAYCTGAGALCGTLHDRWTTSSVITAGTWQHIAVAYDDAADDIALYVNGVEQAAQTFSGAPLTSSLVSTSLPVVLGDVGVYDPVDGLMDEVRVYSRILSAGEIAALYNSGTGCAD